MEKNLFKNKNKRVMDCDDSSDGRAESEWTLIIVKQTQPASTGSSERSTDEIYFCIFVITCYNQLIDKKIYIIKR